MDTALSLYEINTLISILRMVKMRFKEMKGLVQGHRASKQRSPVQAQTRTASGEQVPGSALCPQAP